MVSLKLVDGSTLHTWPEKIRGFSEASAASQAHGIKTFVRVEGYSLSLECANSSEEILAMIEPPPSASTPVRGQRRVVCAAVRFEDGDMLVGPRHFDKVMREQADRREGAEVEAYTQGFIDQHGVFMTREEALDVALKAGQRIFRCGGDESKLYSENLY